MKVAVLQMLFNIAWWKFNGVSGLLPGSIIRAKTHDSETSVNFHQAMLRNLSEDSHTHIRRRKPGISPTSL
jgi:hypothetical protein